MQANAVESSYERLNPRAVLDGKNSRTRPESSKPSQTLQRWLWFPYRHMGMIILTVYQVRISPLHYKGMLHVSCKSLERTG